MKMLSDPGIWKTIFRDPEYIERSAISFFCVLMKILSQTEQRLKSYERKRQADWKKTFYHC